MTRLAKMKIAAAITAIVMIGLGLNALAGSPHGAADPPIRNPDDTCAIKSVDAMMDKIAVESPTIEYADMSDKQVLILKAWMAFTGQARAEQLTFSRIKLLRDPVNSPDHVYIGAHDGECVHGGAWALLDKVIEQIGDIAWQGF